MRRPIESLLTWQARYGDVFTVRYAGFGTGVYVADLGRFSPGGRLARRLRAADAMLYEEIERRRAQHDLDQRDDVLSLLLRARDEEGRALSDTELRDELFTLLAAGHETTATALAFAFELLMRNPGVLARLCER